MAAENHTAFLQPASGFFWNGRRALRVGCWKHHRSAALVDTSNQWTIHDRD